MIDYLKKFVLNPKYHKYFIGFIASVTHMVLITIVFAITVFSFNIRILSLTFLLTLFLLYLNHIVKNCPLTHMENESYQFSVVDFFNKLFPIDYDPKRKYEVQLQYIFISLAIIGTKILFFLVKDDIPRMYDIKYTF